MTIYLDLIFFLNFFFDFFLLLTVNNTLKRNMTLKRIFLGAFVGSFTFFTLFIPMNSFFLFFLKVVLALLMCIVSFGLKDKKYTIQNLIYLYMTSTVLGGFLYFLNLSVQEQQNGLFFVYSKISINYLFLVIVSPISLYIYYKERKKETEYQNYYEATITLLNGKKIRFHSYLDTGNKLKDPISKKYILLISKKKISPKDLEFPLYVPYHSLNHEGIMKCFKIASLEINGKKSKNYLIGISEGKLLSNGVDCILNAYCLEELL